MSKRVTLIAMLALVLGGALAAPRSVFAEEPSRPDAMGAPADGAVAGDTAAPAVESAPAEEESRDFQKPGTDQPEELQGSEGSAAPATDAAASPEKPGATGAAPAGGQSAIPVKRQEGNGPMIANLVLLGVMFGVMYLLVFRPQAKQNQERQKMLAGIQTGDEVQLSGGILGTVRKIKDDIMTVQISEGVDVRVKKEGVTLVKSSEKGKEG